ncbi:hypothetical protein BdWA1_001269 [Babesia duncani]|uniref:Uncharacterized protein n=1 Tax=Babesia duncani TaxID=323732 RepID=A0AAD9PNQ6_9APIC|nr:hypothetical protein BdWA1_001269 [Babesia duncani]
MAIFDHLNRINSERLSRSRSREAGDKGIKATDHRRHYRGSSVHYPNRCRSHELNTRAEKELPYVFQQAEFIRIAVDIIRKCSAEDILRCFLNDLDKGEAVDISQFPDDKLRKKLRHISKALYLERDDLVYRKPPECKISLVSILEDKLDYLKNKAAMQGPYERRSKNKVEAAKDQQDKKPKPLSKDEAAKLLSLREMHEQGFFVDYDNIHKEFMNRHAIIDVWGKSPEEQLALMRAKESGKVETEQPWRPFDREKDLATPSKMSFKEYKSLQEASKSFKASLDDGRTFTSFM